jgi:Nif-specific regulatory protein
MHDERPLFLRPDPGVLPLLFEVSRLLGRHAEIAEALPPLLELLETGDGGSGGGTTLKGGVAALGVPGSGEAPRIVPAPGAGSSTPRREAAAELLARCMREGRPVEDKVDFALPVFAGGEAVGALAFHRSSADPRRESSLAAAVASLLAEAILLRTRLLLVPGAEGEDAMADRDEPRRQRLAGVLPPAEEPLAADYEGGARGIIGRSAAMRELFQLMDRVSGTDATVLVSGESGTGKELVARALHERSPRADKPIVAVNCAALPESVIESELFGHEKGAFTGAAGQRLGRFELADKGTLFLDEIGDLGPAVQAKLLRVLQEGEFQRVGGTATIRVDVRVIAATNRDLEREIGEGRFREDLYWRLNVFPIRVPPLRERRSDIVLLADHFAESLARRHGKSILRISSPAIDLLMTYHWPGNVRELENCIERAVILSQDSVIHAYHLPPSLQSAESTGTGPATTLDGAMARLERELVIEALKLERGKAVAAARRLGITERRMGLAMRKYSIDWKHYRTKM